MLKQRVNTSKYNIFRTNFMYLLLGKNIFSSYWVIRLDFRNGSNSKNLIFLHNHFKTVWIRLFKVGALSKKVPDQRIESVHLGIWTAQGIWILQREFLYDPLGLLR